jgi:DNA-binding NtrC family response regulator
MASATILIVDDNGPLARSLAELLARRRFRTLVAETAATALRLVRRVRPDLVIADMELPDGSGGQLADRLAQVAPRTPVILITASCTERMVGPVIGSVFATVGKPFDPLRLVALVRRALGGPASVSLEFPLVRWRGLLPVRRGPEGLGIATTSRCRRAGLPGDAEGP